MIPKIIHYCWFGRGPKPELALKCIESWKEFCPDYELVEWNEDSFDINSNQYVKEAYEAKKYAFVSDYVRLYALYTVGGIYMDTDVMVLKNLDGYLHNEAFCGFESETKINTGTLACVKGFPLFQKLLADYDDRVFVQADGTLDVITNVETISKLMIPWGFIPNGKMQTVEGLTIYPKNVFCPGHKRLEDKTYMENAAAIHYFSGSWKSAKELKQKNSWWWKCLVVPVSKASKTLEKVCGKPYIWLKERLWRRNLSK